MIRIPLLLLGAAVLTVSCQNPRNLEIIADQDRNLEAYDMENKRLRNQRDMAIAESASQVEQLNLEQARAAELSQRVAAMEADIADRDKEVDDLKGRFAGTGIGVERRGDWVVLNVPSSLTFKSGSSTLNTKGKGGLQKVAQEMSGTYAGKTFWIEGHTDNDPITKSKWESNLHLSAARALSVANFLIKDSSVDASSIRVAAYGENSPKVDNKTKEGKAGNRRVEIVILD